jgi:Kinesin motor domain
LQTHTILGSRSQRGLTQLALDVIFRSLGRNILDCGSNPSLEHTINASDSSEATIYSAASFLETVYADPAAPSRASSRAPTPMIVRSTHPIPPFPHIFGEDEDACFGEEDYPLSHAKAAATISVLPTRSPKSVRVVSREDSAAPPSPPAINTPSKGIQLYMSRGNPKEDGSSVVSHSNAPPHGSLQRGNQYQRMRQTNASGGAKKSSIKHFMSSTVSLRQKTNTKTVSQPQGESFSTSQTPSRRIHRPSVFPQQPDVSALSVSSDPSSEYAVVISMYEVYNDRIFDLLTPPIKSAATKEYRRRPLLFKSTETSPDRKVVAGLRKVVCSNLHQALMVLEAGLHERRVAGTGSNSVSSRSHGFFCVEVKKRPKSSRRHGLEVPWGGSALTIVDLAGSERARDAKTAGATLAEAGKINESLMYLGQCLQMQSDAASKDRVCLIGRNFPSPFPLTQNTAQLGAVPAMQADRVTFLQLLPIYVFVLVVYNKTPEPAKGRHGRHRRSPWRLQRDVPNLAV